jgi:hypothetical protein
MKLKPMLMRNAMATENINDSKKEFRAPLSAMKATTP